MSVETQQDEIVTSIHDAFGIPRRSHPYEGFTDGDGNLYRFVCVVKGADSGSPDVFYNGVDEWDEAAQYAEETAYDSMVVHDVEGIWLVVAIVDTTDGSIYYPDVTVRTPERPNGNLTDWGV